jgi:ABC-type antimicrobial peptide transport system permease subunit
MNDGDSSLVARAVVGVVDDVRQSPTDAQVADVYVPLVQAPTRFAAIVVKSRQPTRGAVDFATSLRRTVKLIDPEATVGQPQALSTIIDDQVRRPRFLLALFGAFGLFAGAIGVLGVYAVTGYSAQQREREIAVRIAVGAERRSVVRMFLRQAARQLTLGLALGLFAAWGMGRLLMAQLFGTSPIAPVTLGVIAVMLTTACGCAVAWPAWRASGLDPTTSLRAP